jgi:hypothetical protein
MKEWKLNLWIRNNLKECSCGLILTYYPIIRRLGGVVVSVLATGPKGRGFKPGRGDGFLRAIKIGSTPSFGWEVKPCRKIIRHVKHPWGTSDTDKQNSHSFVHSYYFPQMSLLVGLPESSGGRVSRHHNQHGSSCSNMTWRMNNRPAGGRLTPPQSINSIIRLQRKTTKPLSQDSRSPGQYLNPRPPEYDEGVLTTRPRRSVIRKKSMSCARHLNSH